MVLELGDPLETLLAHTRTRSGERMGTAIGDACSIMFTYEQRHNYGQVNDYTITRSSGINRGSLDCRNQFYGCLLYRGEDESESKKAVGKTHFISELEIAVELLLLGVCRG